jgi:16S rRNA (guanine1207-N2)-methyltransferase
VLRRHYITWANRFKVLARLLSDEETSYIHPVSKQAPGRTQIMDIIKNFSGSTQLLASSLQGRQAAKPLFVLPKESGLPELFADSFSCMDFLYHDYAVYRHDRDSVASDHLENVQLQFTPQWKKTEGLHDLACIYLPKSSDLIEFVFSTVNQTLEHGAGILIVGPKKSAIKSSKPIIEKHFGEILFSRSGRHCVLVEARKTTDAPAPTWEKEFSVAAFGHELRVCTLPGVFSHGKLDEGTAFLLEHLKTLRFKRALDWGCGSGVIGGVLKLAYPDSTVDFVDSSIMAIESTRRTLAANGLESDRVWPSDIFSDIDAPYDLIVSNPPFHAELKADFSATQRFIREAGNYLTAPGRLVIVANAFINYFKDLRQCFKDVDVIAEDKRYRVIAAGGAIRR